MEDALIKLFSKIYAFYLYSICVFSSIDFLKDLDEAIQIFKPSLFENCFEISNYAKNYITNELKINKVPSKVINHGISSLFINQKSNKIQKIKNRENTLKLIYVSTVHVYKNQWNVIDAIYKLRQSGIKVTLTLIGPIIYPPSGKKMFSKMSERDPQGEFIKYIPHVPHEELPLYYSSHDAIIFASYEDSPYSF